MATTTVSGSTVTFSNSGAAANLSQTGTEDGTLQFTFDVLAASGGGKNTTTYSVDDGVAGDDNSPVTTNKAFATYDTDLLYKDSAVTGWSNGGDTSALGANVWIGTDGKIHYDATNIVKFQHLGIGETTTDTIKYTIKMSNGTLSVGTLTVVINGSNDAAVIGTPTVSSVTEDVGVDGSSNLTASGTLSIADADQGQASFQTTVSAPAGVTNLGSLVLQANGSYTYSVANSATQSLGEGQTKVDTFTVTALDGTTKQVSFTILGSNDAAVITGSSTAALTESNAAQTTGGTLVATDPDSSNAFVVQSNVAGSNGYGTFAIDAAGTWTYTMNDAHDEFVGGRDYTDSLTVKTADGTSQVITVTIHGSNDAAVLSSATAALTETDAALSTTGTLTITDVDSAATFVAQSNTAGKYGSFSIDDQGAWTYVASSAHDAFVGGVTYTDSFDVVSQDGTHTSVTVNILGSNDAAVITGSSTAALTESNAAQTTGGTLVATDPDSSNAFVVQSNVAGSNGYGTFAIDAAGTWTYTMNDAHDEFVGGRDYTDSLTVKTADGTSQVITVTIHGSNDAAVLSGTQATLGAGTEDTNYTINASDLLVGFSDVDGDELSVSELTANHGSLVDNGNGTWTFKPAGDYNGPVSLSYNVIDGHGGSVAATQSFSLAAVNDAPTAVVLSKTVTSTPENGGSVKVADIAVTDVDSGTNVLSLSGADALSFSISGGALYFNGGANFEAKASYDVTVNVNDATVGGTPDALQIFHLDISDVVEADSDTSNDHDTDTATATTTDWGETNGTDVKVGNGSDNIIKGGNGGDTLYGAGGNDTLNGNNGVDQIYGQAGNDTLNGDNDGDTLYGGSGDDLLSGGGGGDQLWGGSGNDTFRFTAAGDSSGNNLDTIHDFHHGFDKIDVHLIDSGDGGAGDFAFGGTVAAGHGVWYTEGGGNTTLHFDTNGSTGSDEMTIILKGIGLGLTASDFLL